MTPYDIDFYPECCLARARARNQTEFGGEDIPVPQEVRQHDMDVLERGIARAHALIQASPATVQWTIEEMTRRSQP